MSTPPAWHDRLRGLLHDHPWWPELTLDALDERLEQFETHLRTHRQFVIAFGLLPEAFAPRPPVAGPRSGLESAPVRPVAAEPRADQAPDRRGDTGPTPPPAITRPDFLPASLFREPHWLGLRLGRLYDTRMTSSPEPSAARPHAYTWVRYANGTAEAVTAPADASLLTGLSEDDALQVERGRAGLFDFKLAVLEAIRRAIDGRKDSGAASALRERCFGLVESAFTSRQVKLFLRLDRRDRGSDAGGGDLHPTRRRYRPGGLSDLLELAGEVELELREMLTAGLVTLLPQPLLSAIRDDRDPPRAVRQRVIDRAAAAAAVAACRRWEWEVHFQTEVAARLSASLRTTPARLFGVRQVDAQAELVRRYAADLAARAAAGRDLRAPFAPDDKPHWAGDDRCLFFRGRLVADYRAARTESHDMIGPILARFQASDWASTIPDPVIDGRRTSEQHRKERVKTLNEGVKGEELHFGRHVGGYRWTPGPKASRKQSGQTPTG